MNEESNRSMFQDAEDLVPPCFRPGMTIPDLIAGLAETCFEARNVAAGARLYERMVSEGDAIWLGIAGAGIAGGMGGQVAALLNASFIDAICSTGAQVYHDLHFAFGLPVKKISPRANDNLLRKHGDTRIYDIGIRDQETLCAQDLLIREFVKECRDTLTGKPLASWELNYQLGQWAERRAPYPDRSFVIAAARLGVPIFYDSLANHSIAINLLAAELDGISVHLSVQREIMDSAAIVYGSPSSGFVELGGGGPKNFIQQTSPVIQHVLGIEFEGAERGLQIGAAVERDGSLSGCTFGESVTWGKYRSADSRRLVQIWGEYSVIFPLLTAYVLDRCKPRRRLSLVTRMPELTAALRRAFDEARAKRSMP